MIYQVIIDGQTFKVEIVDLHTRPIRVLVDGESFEIWPEGQAAGTMSQPTISAPASARPAEGPRQSTLTNSNAGREPIKAPIPGVILSIAISPGDRVKAGQELCVLEAMKMKNLIRSARDGVIAVIHVVPGQTVYHNELLMEYEPQELGDR